jgi:putative endonuclease
MQEKQFYVYIMASRENGTIYIGVTSDLIKRVYQHKNEITKGHTSKYNIKLLVHYEIYGKADDAILREKRLKKWTRSMKNDLITKQNPLWKDLYDTIAFA